MADANIGGRRSGFWNEGFTGRRLKSPSRRTADENKLDIVGSCRWVGLGHPCQEVSGRGAVSSVNGEGVGEVFVHRYGLIGRSSGESDPDVGRISENQRLSTGGRWIRFSIIVHFTQAGLVRGEGRAVRRGVRCAVDNICCITVQSRRSAVVGEGTDKVVGSVYICRI